MCFLQWAFALQVMVSGGLREDKCAVYFVLQFDLIASLVPCSSTFCHSLSINTLCGVGFSIPESNLPRVLFSGMKCPETWLFGPILLRLVLYDIFANKKWSSDMSRGGYSYQIKLFKEMAQCRGNLNLQYCARRYCIYSIVGYYPVHFMVSGFFFRSTTFVRVQVVATCISIM